jgi:hypothetical protein
MRGVHHINTEYQLYQFIVLWSKLQHVQLVARPDNIYWNVNARGEYSASSAYGALFHGRLLQPDLEQVWKTKAEGKVEFYVWLLLQNRNWIVERLRSRGWPHDDTCSLCDQELETAAHLALFCPFAKEVWHGLQATFPRVAMVASSSTSISSWWTKITRGRQSEGKKKEVAMAMYVVWNIWKERGRRIFQQKTMTVLEIEL